MALYELDKPTSLAGGNLDIGDLAKALEEGSELILGDVARKSTNKHGGVVRVRELVHRLRGTVVAHRRSIHAVHAKLTTLRHPHAIRSARATALVLRCGSRDAHGAIAAVHALHFAQRGLLLTLIAEAHKSVAARHTANRVRHDLGRLAARVFVLEKGNQNKFGNFGSQITNEDRELRSTVIATSALRISLKL